MNNRGLKDLLYEQVARVGKALAGPKRLEMLAQGEKSVEAVAEAAAIDIKLTSAHLKALKEARPVQSRRDSKRMFYRLSGQDVAQLCQWSSNNPQLWSSNFPTHQRQGASDGRGSSIGFRAG